MTVEELINKLKNYPEGFTVWVHIPGEDALSTLESIKTRKLKIALGDSVTEWDIVILGGE